MKWVVDTHKGTPGHFFFHLICLSIWSCSQNIHSPESELCHFKCWNLMNNIKSRKKTERSARSLSGSQTPRYDVRVCSAWSHVQPLKKNPCQFSKIMGEHFIFKNKTSLCFFFMQLPDEGTDMYKLDEGPVVSSTATCGTGEPSRKRVHVLRSESTKTPTSWSRRHMFEPECCFLYNEY